jgi:hypothetical protein
MRLTISMPNRLRAAVSEGIASAGTPASDDLMRKILWDNAVKGFGEPWSRSKRA